MFLVIFHRSSPYFTTRSNDVKRQIASCQTGNKLWFYDVSWTLQIHVNVLKTSRINLAWINCWEGHTMRGSRQTPKKERPQWRQCVQIQDVATCGDNALSDLRTSLGRWHVVISMLDVTETRKGKRKEPHCRLLRSSCRCEVTHRRRFTKNFQTWCNFLSDILFCLKLL